MCENCNCEHAQDGNSLHHKSLISNIHSCLENELENANIYVCDDADCEEKRNVLTKTPNDVRAMVELADALVYQMRYKEAVELFEKAVFIRPDNFEIHRKLAARYMSTLRIAESKKEFVWCDERTNDKLDTQYRLALCSYYEDDCETALKYFDNCYEYCVQRDEMLIAVIFWEILCSVKLGRDLSKPLSHYNDNIKCGHHVGYMQAVKLFNSNDLNLDVEIDKYGELARTLFLYGKYYYLIYKGDNSNADKAFEELIKLNTYFSSFVYLGAHLDMIRKSKN